jgi:hypothetical protein
MLHDAQVFDGEAAAAHVAEKRATRQEKASIVHKRAIWDWLQSVCSPV